MKLTHIYTGADDKSHFEDLDIPEVEERRLMAGPIASDGVIFGSSPALDPQDWHNAPRRQIVALLGGAVEIQVGNGEKRRFGVGDCFFADDLTGQGHLTWDVQGPILMLYVLIPDDLDPTPWRP